MNAASSILSSKQSNDYDADEWQPGVSANVVGLFSFAGLTKKLNKEWAMKSVLSETL